MLSLIQSIRASVVHESMQTN